ncbi:hypothetical protein FRC01_000013 [Tulasnella sp. 417]|nr:hypothetical protein FRC01_000013 [Tulasnella sp. 417]
MRPASLSLRSLLRPPATSATRTGRTSSFISPFNGARPLSTSKAAFRPLLGTGRTTLSKLPQNLNFHKAFFRTTPAKKDVFFIAFPALKAGLLDISRVTLLVLPFVYRARHRLDACLDEEGPLIMPSTDARVQMAVRVAERIIAVLGDDCTLPSHYVSTAVWPTSLSPSFYEEFFRGESNKIRPNQPNRKRPSEEYEPSAVATSHLLPHRLESSNPNKVFTEQDWKIYVIDLPKINAFALPTRELFVYRGLIDLLNDDALLSGVIAHEIAHVTQRHAVENAGFLSLAALAFDCLRGISFAFTISFPLITDAMGSALNLIHNHVASKAYSRKLEMEADAVGLRFMSMAGYHPNSMLDLWDVMALVEEEAAASGEPISITDRVPFLKTHPTSLQRQRNIDSLLPKAMKMYQDSPFTRSSPSPSKEVASNS